MDFRSLVRNELVQDDSSVWMLAQRQHFAYSEGAGAERYLETVLRGAADLSSDSIELERHIRDWSSEYHLTSKRAQLLAGLALPRSALVLEVGCGCGAITRHLGENFTNVVSIEGSLSRARLARLRTRDLPGVHILCAPFQQIAFTERFDVIFCIGVYEYSGEFVDGADPYDSVLRYFKELLKPNGIVVIAIENQFGLKYFSSSREDHVPRMFEGIEGYHRRLANVRTFGRTELEDNVRKHFDTVRFLYPYPDYKLPDCVLAEEFVASPSSGELLSQLKSRDYGHDTTPLWDESLVTLELARNRALPFFANSFLVLAGHGELSAAVFPQLGVWYSSSARAKPFRTMTRLLKDESGELVAVKRARERAGPEGDGRPLRLRDTESQWTRSHSIQTVVYTTLADERAELAKIFAPCKAWLEALRLDAIDRDGDRYLPGDHIDATWQNAYLDANNCRFIDLEWVWAHEIRLSVLVIRAIYVFLLACDNRASHRFRGSGRRSIRDIAEAIGVTLDERDFADFVTLEAEFQSLASDLDRRRVEIVLRWFLLNRPSLRAFNVARRQTGRVARRIADVTARVVDRRR